MLCGPAHGPVHAALGGGGGSKGSGGGGWGLRRLPRWARAWSCPSLVGERARCGRFPPATLARPRRGQALLRCSLGSPWATRGPLSGRVRSVSERGRTWHRGGSPLGMRLVTLCGGGWAPSAPPRHGRADLFGGARLGFEGNFGSAPAVTWVQGPHLHRQTAAGPAAWL